MSERKTHKVSRKSGANTLSQQKIFAASIKKKKKLNHNKEMRLKPKPGHWKCVCHRWNVDELDICEHCKRPRVPEPKLKEEHPNVPKEKGIHPEDEGKGGV